MHIYTDRDEWRQWIASWKFKSDFADKGVQMKSGFALEFKKNAFWFLETYRYLDYEISIVDWCFKNTIIK